MHRIARSAPIDPHILDEAADWLMRLNAGIVTDEDRAACERWRQTSPDHARAWARAERLLNKLGSLPPSLAMPALDRPPENGRRAALAKLSALLLAIPMGWTAWRLAEERGWTADLRTAIGEHREQQLADGSRVTLNTATAVDVRFDAAQRFVQLRAGEILVHTAKDTSVMRRPFYVSTADGLLEALGTRFSVRREEGRTFVAVLEGAVRIEPRSAGAFARQILRAGEQAWFTANGVGPVMPADDTATAWTRGMLSADRMRLADFAAELARYRSGIVRCDPAVANLRISGAFPVADTDRALAMLVATYPVAVSTRMGGYWVNLSAR